MGVKITLNKGLQGIHKLLKYFNYQAFFIKLWRCFYFFCKDFEKHSFK